MVWSGRNAAQVPVVICLLTVCWNVCLASAVAQDDQCALYLNESKVCFKDHSEITCSNLFEIQRAEAKNFRCLVRDADKLKNCKAVYIAFNTFVRLRPFKVMLEG